MTETLRILVAEKQALIALEIEVLLTELTGSSVTVCSRKDMQRELESAPFDVVLVDAVSLPDNNRATWSMLNIMGLGVVFLTSFDEVPGFTAGQQGFAMLSKPFDEASLLAAVKAAVAKRHAAGQRG
ncbi:response regulator transcription factor [Allorhizobium undicola]|uniref:response regulator transcription factor n=2 Tax=Allorhizobium undicola TaxID=78527 RepID=UPI00048288C7|nr:response regulator transcription factor [Allorhizobium undicola]